MGPGETHQSKQRDRGRSHLYGEVFVESKTLCPPGTAHCCSALGRATFGKGVQARCGSSFFFYPSIDITLASINIPPSMSGSSCEGYTFRLSGSWLPLTWELSLSRAGNPGQWEIPWPLQLAFSKQGWGGGTGGHWCTLKMWFPVKTESQLKNIWEKLPYISPS